MCGPSKIVTLEEAIAEIHNINKDMDDLKQKFKRLTELLEEICRK